MLEKQSTPDSWERLQRYKRVIMVGMVNVEVHQGHSAWEEGTCSSEISNCEE